jgi:hypothetical protein
MNIINAVYLYLCGFANKKTNIFLYLPERIAERLSISDQEVEYAMYSLYTLQVIEPCVVLGWRDTFHIIIPLARFSQQKLDGDKLLAYHKGQAVGVSRIKKVSHRTTDNAVPQM